MGVENEVSANSGPTELELALELSLEKTCIDVCKNCKCYVPNGSEEGELSLLSAGMFFYCG